MRRPYAGSFGEDRISDGLTIGTCKRTGTWKRLKCLDTGASSLLRYDFKCSDTLAVNTDFLQMNLSSWSSKGFDLLFTTHFVDRKGYNVMHQC
jgi:hypothetical protein